MNRTLHTHNVSPLFPGLENNMPTQAESKSVQIKGNGRPSE